MGVIRFVAPGQEEALRRVASRSYLVSIEGLPWETRSVFRDGQLRLDRETQESGALCVPWSVNGGAELLLQTSTLIERDRPYLLQLELARGTLNRYRNQIAVWQMLGVPPNPEAIEHGHRATEFLAEAATAKDILTASRRSEMSIESSLRAMELAAPSQANHALIEKLKGRRRPSNALLGARIDEKGELPNGREFSGLFSSVAVPFSWRDMEVNVGESSFREADERIEWAKANGLKVVGGPLLEIDRRSLPDWIYLWEDEVEELASLISNFVKTIVQRYRGKVSIWNCASRVNVDGAMRLSEDDMLRLTISVLDIVQTYDSRAPMIVSFDQPWCEAMAFRDRTLPPMHFADTLARADLGLSGIGLEINWGYWPGGSAPRDLFEISRLIDRWSLLGLPLFVWLTSPSQSGADTRARKASSVILGSAATPDRQAAFAKSVCEMLLAKPLVQGAFWGQWSDATPHDYPWGGLMNENGEAKPIFEALRGTGEKLDQLSSLE